MGGILSKGFSDHVSVLLGDELWIWGGYRPDLPLAHDTPKKKQLFTSSVAVFKILDSGPVQKLLTTGTPPNGTIDYSCCCNETDIYYYGGSCLMDDCYHDDLFRLDTTNKAWSVLSTGPGAIHAKPTKKAGSGMISFTENSLQYLLIIGGHTDDLQITNEVHMMCLSRPSPNGALWTTPRTSGDPIDPLSGFTIDTLPSRNEAILFGGRTKKNDRLTCTNVVYTMSYTKNTVNFRKLVHTIGSPQPQARFNHSSAIISIVRDGVKKYYLIVMGGEDCNHRMICDCWILDIEQQTWQEFPLQMIEVAMRAGHYINQLKMSENRVWLIITGGRSSQDKVITSPYNIVILELVYKCDENCWNAGDVMLPEKAQPQVYKEYLLLSLSRARKEQEEISLKRDEQCRKQSMQLDEKDTVVEQKELQITELKMKMLQTEQTNKELNRCKEQMVKQVGIIRQKEEKIHEQEQCIHQKTRIVEIQQRELGILNQQSKEQKQRLDEQKQFLDSSRFDKDDVTLTNDKIGNGAYGEVRIGVFRGVRVAVKLMHEMIASSHNRKLFQKEREMCVSISHPNIVQFIGSIDSDKLLFELMSTTLADQIGGTNPRLSRSQIIAIALDICGAMCYLHQWRPQPIIHKDISSYNILMNPLPNNWKAKLADFGSANINSEVPGNSFYSAPEALSVDAGIHSPAMDVYSFGNVLTDMALHCLRMVDHRKHISEAKAIDWVEMQEVVMNCIKENFKLRISSAQLLTELEKLD